MECIFSVLLLAVPEAVSSHTKTRSRSAVQSILSLAPRCPRGSLVPYKSDEHQFHPVLVSLGTGAPMHPPKPPALCKKSTKMSNLKQNGDSCSLLIRSRADNGENLQIFLLVWRSCPSFHNTARYACLLLIHSQFWSIFQKVKNGFPNVFSKSDLTRVGYIFRPKIFLKKPNLLKQA